MTEEWVEYLDEAGKPYYFNPTSGETSWENPLQSATAAAPASDSNWSELTDEGGNTFYQNTTTGEVQWDRPENFRSNNAVEKKLVLPENWQEYAEGDTVYYFNSITGETSWEHPGKNAVSTSQQSLEDLKKLWIEHYDEASGKYFYENTQTHDMTWDSPFPIDEGGGNEESGESTKPAQPDNDFDLFSAAKLFLPGATTTTNTTKSPAQKAPSGTGDVSNAFIAAPTVYNNTPAKLANTPTSTPNPSSDTSNNTNKKNSTPTKKISFTGSSDGKNNHDSTNNNNNNTSHVPDGIASIVMKLQSIEWQEERYTTHPIHVAHQLLASIPLKHCTDTPIIKCLQPIFMKQYSFYHYLDLYFHTISTAYHTAEGTGGSAGSAGSMMTNQGSGNGNSGNSNGNTGNGNTGGGTNNRRNSFLSPQQIEKLLRYQPDSITNPLALSINSMLASMSSYGNAGTIGYNMMSTHSGTTGSGGNGTTAGGIPSNPVYQDALSAFQLIQSFMIPAISPTSTTTNTTNINGGGTAGSATPFPSYLSSSTITSSSSTHPGQNITGTYHQHFQYYYSLLQLLQQHAPTTSASPFSTFAHSHALTLPYPLPTLDTGTYPPSMMNTNTNTTNTSGNTTSSAANVTAANSTSTNTTNTTTNTGTHPGGTHTTPKSVLASLPTIEFIDEIYLQVCKQIRYNPSLPSVELGWQLLVLIMIYQLPTFHFLPYFYTFCIRQYTETTQSITTTTQNMSKRQQEMQYHSSGSVSEDYTGTTGGMHTNTNSHTNSNTGNNALAILIQEKKDFSHHTTISKCILQCITMMFQYYSKFYEDIHTHTPSYTSTTPQTRLISIPFNSTRKVFPSIFELESALIQEPVSIPIATILPSVYHAPLHSYTTIADVLIAYIQETFLTSQTITSADHVTTTSQSGISKEEVNFLLSRMQMTVHHYYDTSYLTMSGTSNGPWDSSSTGGGGTTTTTATGSGNSNAYTQHWSLLWLHEEPCALDDRLLDIITAWSMLLPPPESVLHTWLEGSHIPSPAPVSTTGTGGKHTGNTSSSSTGTSAASGDMSQSLMQPHQLISEVHSFYFQEYMQEHMYGSQYHFTPYQPRQHSPTPSTTSTLPTTRSSHTSTSTTSHTMSMSSHTAASSSSSMGIPKGVIKSHFLIKLYLYYPYYPSPTTTSSTSSSSTSSTSSIITNTTTGITTGTTTTTTTTTGASTTTTGGTSAVTNTNTNTNNHHKRIGKEFWLFRQCVYDLLLHYYPIPLSDTLFFAALQCQWQHGDYSITKDIPPLNLTGMNGKYLPLIFTPAYIQYTSPLSESTGGGGKSHGHGSPLGNKHRKTLTINTNFNTTNITGTNTITNTNTNTTPHTNTGTGSHTAGGKLKSSLSSSKSSAPSNPTTNTSTTHTTTTSSTTNTASTTHTNKPSHSLAGTTVPVTVQEIIPKIIHLYKKLHGLGAEKLVSMFLITLQSKKLYGAKYFPVYHHPILSPGWSTTGITTGMNTGITTGTTSTHTHSVNGHDMMEYFLAISTKSIMLLHPATIAIVMEFPFEELHNFKHSFDSFVVIIKSTTTTSSSSSMSSTSNDVPATPGRTSSNKDSNSSGNVPNSATGSPGKLLKYYFQTTNGQEIESVLMAYLQQYNPALLDAISTPPEYTGSSGSSGGTASTTNPTSGSTSNTITGTAAAGNNEGSSSTSSTA